MTGTVETKRAPMVIDSIEEDGTFSGYASIFGAVDLGKDRVERGAFAKSLQQRSVSGIRMLFQHDPAAPIGTWSEIREDERGLHVKGRVLGEAGKGAEVLGLMRAGAVDGLSIGFRTKRSRTDAKSGIRTILEADLWEISVVTFPMLPQARVSHVKAAGGLPTTREFERWLTQDAGLSRSQARTVIGEGFASLFRKQDAAPQTGTWLAGRIKRAARRLRA